MLGNRNPDLRFTVGSAISNDGRVPSDTPKNSNAERSKRTVLALLFQMIRLALMRQIGALSGCSSQGSQAV